MRKDQVDLITYAALAIALLSIPLGNIASLVKVEEIAQAKLASNVTGVALNASNPAISVVSIGPSSPNGLRVSCCGREVSKAPLEA